MLEKKWYTSLATSMLVHVLIFGLCLLGLSYANQKGLEYMEVAVVDLSTPPETVPQDSTPENNSSQGSAVEPLVVAGPATAGDIAVRVPESTVKGTGNYIGNSSGGSGAGTVAAPPKAPAGPTRGAKIVASPKPNYPNVARQNGWEGTVKLNVYVAADGGVEDVQILGSSGHDQLDQSAVSAVRNRWQFSPALREGQPVAGWKSIAVRFELDA